MLDSELFFFFKPTSYAGVFKKSHADISYVSHGRKKKIRNTGSLNQLRSAFFMPFTSYHRSAWTVSNQHATMYSTVLNPLNFRKGNWKRIKKANF